MVLDASWNRGSHRELVRRLGVDTSTDLVELRCVLAPEIAAQRIEERARRGGDASDADTSIARSMAAAADPWPESVAVDTAQAPDLALEAALAMLGAPHGRPVLE